MRFSYAESMTDPAFCASLARAAEDAGYEEDQGVTDVVVGFRWPYQVGPDSEALTGKLAKLRRFADGVIAKVKG